MKRTLWKVPWIMLTYDAREFVKANTIERSRSVRVTILGRFGVRLYSIASQVWGEHPGLVHRRQIAAHCYTVKEKVYQACEYPQVSGEKEVAFVVDVHLVLLFSIAYSKIIFPTVMISEETLGRSKIKGLKLRHRRPKLQYENSE